MFALVLLGLIGVTCGVAVTPTPTPTRFSNSTTSTSSGSLSPTTSACCFVVLDTIYENWWEEISTSTVYSIVNLTSITTLVTPYPNITSTNYETNVYTTNATFFFDVDIGYNPITLYTNAAPGPSQTTTILNEPSIFEDVNTGTVNQALTAVTIGGTTIQSPQAFWAYSTVRVITAAAVTDQSGSQVCGTASGFQSVFAEYPVTTVGYISSTKPIVSTISTYSITDSDEPAFTGINSNVGSYFFTNLTATQTGVVISLTTPFVYAPTRGATLVTGEPSDCNQLSGTENYGYPVQTLLDYLVQNPVYSSQYPGLENCLPGGPDILQLFECEQAAPHFEIPGGDLTSSTIITVTPTVAPRPASAVIPTTASPTQTPSTTETVSPLPESTQTSETEGAAPSTTAETLTPSQSPNPDTSSSTEAAAGEQTSTSPENPFSPSINTPSSSESSAQGAASPSTSPNAPVAGQTQTASDDTVSAPPIPSSGSEPSGQEGASSQNAAGATVPPGANSQTSSTVLSPASSSAAAIASAIASLIGAAPITALPTVLSGTSDVVLSFSTTVPLNPAVPLSGSTTVINGVTNVIVSSATTIPVSQLVANLPGSTTEVSGTLNVVLGTGSNPTTVPLNSNLPGLVGSTTVSSLPGGGSETFVVVSIPETLPVVLGLPTASASPSAAAGGSANSSSTGLLQITTSGARTRLSDLDLNLAVGVAFGVIHLGVVLLL